MFLLEKGPEDKVLPIPKNKIMSDILLYLIHFFKYMNDETVKRGFWVLKDMINALPVYQLAFARSKKNWSDVFNTDRGGDNEG